MNANRTVPLLVVLTGPTGTVKSELALELARTLAASRPVEIISADSALVYRGMDIGTAKPSTEARRQVPHHLIDIRDPAQSFSAGEFMRAARAAIDAIVMRGHLPVLVGGTMLYLRALRDGLATLPDASPAIRQELEEQATVEGWPAMHAQLKVVDPQVASRLAPGDAQRIQRALEVYRLTGVPISQWQRRTHGIRDQFRWLRYALLPASRDALRRDLAARFEAMLRAGLVEEVRALHARGDLSERHPSVRAVGYRQLWPYCSGERSLQEATRLAIIATTQLAKRQLTWLRREPGMIETTARSANLSASIAAAVLEADA
jgi:tRNA dimethylallyltransferase